MPEQTFRTLFIALFAFAMLTDVITVIFLATGKISVQRGILLVIMSSCVGLLAILFKPGRGGGG